MDLRRCGRKRENQNYLDIEGSVHVIGIRRKKKQIMGLVVSRGGLMISVFKDRVREGPRK